jgi:hypothetical protein
LKRLQGAFEEQGGTKNALTAAHAIEERFDGQERITGTRESGRDCNLRFHNSRGGANMTRAQFAPAGRA